MYAVYGVLITDAVGGTGVLSALLALWSLTGMLAEVPAGLVVDRLRPWCGRRPVLAASLALQALGYASWLLAPDVAGFAAGFVLWGLGGALGSGVLEALLWDGLAAAGATGAYPRALGRVTAARLLAQVPASLAATVLLVVATTGAVGWASVALCLAVGAAALLLPEVRAPLPQPPEDEVPGLSRAVRAVAASGVAGPVAAVAALAGLDALEEYDAPLAASWGVSLSVLPVALLAVPLAAAVGTGAGGRWASAQSARRLALLIALAGGALLVAGALARPASLGVLAAAYAVYRLVLVAAEARLQEAAPDALRVTTASLASTGSELVAFAVYAAWAAGELRGVALLVLAIGAVLPALLTASGTRRPRPR